MKVKKAIVDELLAMDFAELKSCKEIFSLCSGETVLDLGATLGAFSIEAVKHGAKKAIAVEGDPRLVNIMRSYSHMDDFRDRIEIIEGVVLGNKERPELVNFKVGFSLTDVITCNSVYNNWGRADNIRLQVPSVSFDELIDTYKPTVLKIDIEGAEHTINFGDWMKGINTLFIEVHYHEHPKPIGRLLTKEFPRVRAELNGHNMTYFCTRK